MEGVISQCMYVQFQITDDRLNLTWSGTCSGFQVDTDKGFQDIKITYLNHTPIAIAVIGNLDLSKGVRYYNWFGRVLSQSHLNLQAAEGLTMIVWDLTFILAGEMSRKD